MSLLVIECLFMQINPSGEPGNMVALRVSPDAATVVVDHKTSKQPLDIYPIPEIVTLQYHTLYVPVNAFKNKQYRPQLIFTIRFTKGRSITLHATNARNVVNWMHGLSVLMNHATGYPIITKGKLWWSYLWSSSLFNATRTNTSAWKYLKKEIEEEMK